MTKTSIEWTDFSVNPIRARYAATNGDGHYCEKISPGCANCYASRLQPRFSMPVFDVQRRSNVEPYFDESKLQDVLRRRKPTRWFWCDMTDMFGHWVPDEWIDRCFAVMALTPQHAHQILTKRADRMLEYMSRPTTSTRVWQLSQILASFGHHDPRELVRHWPLSTVWLIVSAEDQQRANERIPLLLQTPAAVRGVSLEPLLGPITLDRHLWRELALSEIPAHALDDGCTEGVKRRRPSIDWVIVGGESGPRARDCDLADVRSIVQQCQAAGVACFVKQLGARPIRLNCDHEPFWHKKGGDPDEWPDDLRVRQFPTKG